MDDERIIDVLTEALGDAHAARLNHALHRLAVTVRQQADELQTVKNAMNKMVPATPPGDIPAEMEAPG